jgi:hypothetical protein
MEAMCGMVCWLVSERVYVAGRESVGSEMVGQVGAMVSFGGGVGGFQAGINIIDVTYGGPLLWTMMRGNWWTGPLETTLLYTQSDGGSQL